MIGGLMKANRFAVLAGSALLAGGLSISPVQAADLGGDCCADLEERVATLEATTARKGNRKVSLTISGWVNSGLFIWDDGVDSDAYVVSENGTTLGTRITFAGNAKINSEWSAGYDITIEAQQDDVLLSGLNQTTDDAPTNFGLFYSYMWIKSEQLGKIGIGQQSQATDNLTVVDTAGIIFANLPIIFDGNTFLLRNQNTGALTGTTWADTLDCLGIGLDCNGVPMNVIRYDSPTIAGFALSASWGEDDFWDVALKYAGEFGQIKVAAAVGYAEVTEDDGAAAGDTETFELAGSIMHTPTGIFVNGAYGTFENGLAGVGAADSESWHVTVGIKQKWNSLGATAIYADYGEYTDNNINGCLIADTDPDTAGCQGVGNAALTGSGEIERYGIGIHQWVDAAAMQLYAKWQHLELESDNAIVDGNDIDTFTLGGVIFF